MYQFQQEMEDIASCFGPPRRYRVGNLPSDFFVHGSQPGPPSPHDVPLLIQVPNLPQGYAGDTVFFRSSNNKDFQVNRHYVEAHASSMIPENWTLSESTVIGLSETASVLNILFQFINPGGPPTLRDLSFESLARVTKAAEKYQVFSAMSICSERMRALSHQYPKQIFVYGLHYNYPTVLDATAPHVVTSEKLVNLFPLLPPSHHYRWLRYYSLWAKALDRVAPYSFVTETEESPVNTACWELCWHIIAKRLSKGVRALNDPAQTFSVPSSNDHPQCSRCRRACANWKVHAESIIAQIPQYSSIASSGDGH
ncbi:hypothetical protein D9756_001998 [Leucocoprinus leucothites]|uniref:BTB domain-containing protein n=1 Tax=Leucocoprinus leucothites TaxID=201217 RepID=A0A8H5GC74_9AGAR|nr:hypothetical protein D9756_001998 [Leucoagaricus leucothites]